MKLLKNIMQMKQNQLHQVMSKYLSKNYDQVIIRDKFIVAIGNTPIGLVAHLDTVHTRPPINFFYDQEQQVLWSPQGLGADDRAGVYAIIQIVEAGYRPHIILCKDEEIGGKGADAVIQMFPQYPFENLKCLIELDRSGKQDCVFYDCDNEDFVKYIEQFGFKEDIGSFSDISILAPQWEVAAVNLSIGYYNEHTKAEYWDLFEADDTITKVINILRSKNNNTYMYIPATKDNRIIRCFCGKLCYPGEYDQITSTYGPTKMPFKYNVCHSCKKLHEEGIDQIDYF